jgi:hypothetical protein
MEAPAITVIHPSLKRPGMAFDTAKQWLDKTISSDNIEYILSLSAHDPKLEDYYRLFAELPFVQIIQDDNPTMIVSVNNAAKLAKGNLIVVTSDDFDCPDGWDVSLILATQYIEDFVLKTDDDIQPTLITLPIMDKAYYNQFGYVYYPGYEHLFCDTELAAVAFMQDKLYRVPLTFHHRHHSRGESPKDEVSEKNDATWEQGRKLFLSRKTNNFGLKRDQIVKHYPQTLLHI